jgi:hypothetical protein
MLLAAAAGLLQAEAVKFRERCLEDIVAQIPGILASQDAKTGRFGKGIWIVTDQNLLLPLAAAWSYKDAKNPYFHDDKVLTAIMSGGDALIEDQDENGQWEFRKKDGSKWGKIYMPWTYSRWIRAFAIIRQAMPEDRRARWEKALLLGYSGIAKEVSKGAIQNIPAHHAMGLYFAGQVFGKPEWKTLATDYLRKVADAQHSDGYWSENKGPVVNYGFVYVDAIGTYYAASKDDAVLPALRKTSVFHGYFTYPDGSDVETVDERNPYHAGVRLPNIGFTFSPEGRSYLQRQIGLQRGRLGADIAASLLLWGQEGEGAAADPAKSDFDYKLPSGDAAIRRRGPWFLVVSAMTAPVPKSRWIQDRQNFVSVYHEKAGLILGGGNTKLQPAWSNFTVGDEKLLFHRPGDENPNFVPGVGLVHVPSSARLLEGAFGVELSYGDRKGRIELDVKSPSRLELKITNEAGMNARATLLPHMGKPLANASGKKITLDAEPIDWRGENWIEQSLVKAILPAGSAVRWPLLPHDPYKKDGRSTPDEGRIVVDLPASGNAVLTLEVAND